MTRSYFDSKADTFRLPGMKNDFDLFFYKKNKISEKRGKRIVWKMYETVLHPLSALVYFTFFPSKNM